MPLKFNGTTVKKVNLNNTEIKKVKDNNTEIWNARKMIPIPRFKKGTTTCGSGLRYKTYYNGDWYYISYNTNQASCKYIPSNNTWSGGSTANGYPFSSFYAQYVQLLTINGLGPGDSEGTTYKSINQTSRNTYKFSMYSPSSGSSDSKYNYSWVPDNGYLLRGINKCYFTGNGSYGVFFLGLEVPSSNYLYLERSNKYSNDYTFSIKFNFRIVIKQAPSYYTGDSYTTLTTVKTINCNVVVYSWSSYYNGDYRPKIDTKFTDSIIYLDSSTEVFKNFIFYDGTDWLQSLSLKVNFNFNYTILDRTDGHTYHQGTFNTSRYIGSDESLYTSYKWILAKIPSQSSVTFLDGASNTNLAIDSVYDFIDGSYVTWNGYDWYCDNSLQHLYKKPHNSSMKSWTTVDLTDVKNAIGSQQYGGQLTVINDELVILPNVYGKFVAQYDGNTWLVNTDTYYDIEI